MIHSTIARRELLLSLGALATNTTLPRFNGALAKIDALFAAEYAQTGAGSIVAGVVSGSELIWSKAYGLANHESRKAATTDNLYRIGSITKQFTSVAFLQLVKSGKVRLTDPVEKYVPEINQVQNRHEGLPPITLLQLATHTSGLSREPDNMETYVTGPVASWDKTLLAALPHVHYAYEPGTRQVYSNIAVGTLGLALGRASGTAYTEYVTQNVIEPLGLKSTTFEPDQELLQRAATGYVLRDGRPDSTVPSRELRTGRGYKVPNGALFTTVGDLARFVSFELGHGPSGVLAKETLKDNFSRIYGADGQLGGGFGIGFQAARKGELVLTGHGGSVAGFIAGAYFHTASDTGLVYLRNLGKPIRADLRFHAFSALNAS
jgi:CubicO group peptidase (beta-lactamase class C family)